MKHKAYKRKDGFWGVKYRVLFVWIPIFKIKFEKKTDAFAYARARN